MDTITHPAIELGNIEKKIPQAIKHLSFERLGQQISNHQVGRNVDELDVAIVNVFLGPKVTDIDMA